MNSFELAESLRELSAESRKQLPTTICARKVHYRLSWSSSDDAWTIHVMTESQQPYFKRTRTNLSDAVKAVQMEIARLEKVNHSDNDTAAGKDQA